MSSIDFDKKYDIFDTVTPRHALLCGRYKRSFAYHALREELPVLLTQTMDDLIKDRDEIVGTFGENSLEELKKIIGQLSKLKYQLQTDKPFEKFEGNESDCEAWNSFIKSLTYEYNTFYRSCWLHTECYVYRKISSFFKTTILLKDFDYFAKRKRIDFNNICITDIVRYMRRADRDYKTFHHLLKINLWCNRSDMFLCTEKKNTASWDSIDIWDNHILVNNSKSIWKCLGNADPLKPIVVDIVCGNAGFELYLDMTLAEYLIDKRLATKVRFHFKAIPWYITNATVKDFYWILDTFRNDTSSLLCEQGRKWKQYLEDEKFFIVPIEYFWTSPHEYFKMRDINLSLYKYLAQAHLIIFKGDINYRKLLGDYCWDPTDDFITCLRGFQPTNLCVLRTLKSDLVCGLPFGKVEDLYRIDAKWMATEDYGLIQFVEKTECGCSLKNNCI